MSIFSKLVVVLVYFRIVNPAPAVSQTYNPEVSDYHDLSDYIQEKFGLDQEIINGTAYYHKYYRVLNHPYFDGEESHPGMVVLSGKRFDNVRIHYNIYEQNLVLEYPGKDDGTYKLVLSPAHTDAFKLNTYYFEKLKLLEQEPAFYQVITSNGITFYVHWKKQMLVTTNNIRYTDFFSDPEQEYYLDYREELTPIKSKKSFALKFPDIPRREIRRYMRYNKISFRNSTPEGLEGLLKFVSSEIYQTAGN